MSKIISIANAKGGCGKSSITIFLATALAHEGNKVLIIDSDTQKSIKDIYDLESRVSDELLVKVEETPPRFVQQYLKMYANEYDYIFLDVPRFTTGVEDNPTTMLLMLCDVVLIPALGSIVDAMSTVSFLTAINDCKEWKDKHGLEFSYYGVINKATQRKDNEKAKEYLVKHGLQMFDSSLSNLKIFNSPTLQQSLLETKDGINRFGSFYNEFKNKFNIK